MFSAIQTLSQPNLSHSETPDWTHILIGALFVLIAAAGRFNSPPTNRSSTTALRFHLAAICYLLFELTLYLGVIFVGAFAEEAGFFAPLLRGQTLPPLSALMLTVLLPNIPLLAESDAWVLDRLQRMGAIPFEARRLAAELRRSSFTVPAALRDRVVARLIALGFKPDEVQLGHGSGQAQTWTRITTMLIQIEDWEVDRRFIGFLARFGALRQEMKAEQDRLAPTLRLLRGMAPEQIEAEGDPLMMHVQNELRERSGALLDSIYSFISRGLLQCGTTYGTRVAELARLGFDVHDVVFRPRISLDQFITVFLAIEGALMGSVLIFAQQGSVSLASPALSFGHQLLQITMVSVMYTVAVLCSVVLKENRRHGRRVSHGRPTSIYVAAGLLATGASLLIRFIFQLVLERSFDDAWQPFRLYSPYSLCAFLAAFMIAWMIDDRPTSRLSRDGLRWTEAIVGGVTLLASSFMAMQWVANLALRHPELQKILAKQPPVPILAVGLPCAIGFAIAYLVPTWYRESDAERELLAARGASEQLVPASV
jgi:hypothetical protein